MKRQSMRGRLLASTMICGVMAMGATAAMAADEAAPEVIVTGSRIPQPNLTSVSPITSINNVELKVEGITKVEDLLNSMPQVFASQGGTISNGSTGTASVNLRNLGTSRTLVLIDGRRVTPGDPSFPYVDLNFIPAALVDRVELDTAAGSSVYGSDAVAGVVNFIMKKDFEGAEINANYSVTQHNNHNSQAQGAIAAAQFQQAPGSVTDGATNDINFVIGVDTPDRKGNATVYAGYRHTDPILQSSRDFSACGLKSHTGGSVTCSGSFTGATGAFFVYDQNFHSTSLTVDKTGAGNTFRPFNSSVPPTDLFNFNPYNYFQRVDERYTGGAFAHYEANRHLDVYAQFMFMDDHTVAQIAPSGMFGQTVTIQCSNPMLSASEMNTLCGPGTTTPSIADGGGGPGTATLAILRRNIEGGPRQDDLRHTDYRTVIGARGEIDSNWHYDIYGSYGSSIYAEQYLNDMSISRELEALNVVTTATPGVYQCASAAARAQGCVPWNIFKTGGVTQAALNYLQTPGFKEGQTTEQVVDASVHGDLGAYGVKSPFAKDGIGVAAGVEYRRETLTLNVDNAFSSGDLAGQGGATKSDKGAFEVREAFAEIRAPLIQDAEFAKSVLLTGSYRNSQYSSAGNTKAYAVGGDWAINNDLLLRASYNRAVRAPNIVELYTPQSVGLDGSADPCAGTMGPTSPTAAQCALTGVSAGQYGHIVANPANQYNGLTGGNPNLKPETADTYSAGFVLTPKEVLRNFSLTVDYFNIKVIGAVAGIGADTIINNCIASGDPLYCNLIHRAPSTGSLWLGTQGYIADTALNVGSYQTSGYDVSANYRVAFSDMGLGDYGSLNFDFTGTYTDEYLVQALPGAKKINCVGLYGTICQGSSTPMSAPTPKWRHKLRTTWNTPWYGIGVSAQWRYLGGLALDKHTAHLNDSTLPAFNYMDLEASWRAKNGYTIRVGVNNVFDKDPPVIGSSQLPPVVGNGNTFPQYYDALGRYMFVNVTADF